MSEKQNGFCAVLLLFSIFLDFPGICGKIIRLSETITDTWSSKAPCSVRARLRDVRFAALPKNNTGPKDQKEVQYKWQRER
ncbi:MAG: hypothetical protein J1E06_08045, partial [Acutalibacter sp.]|nr:hypothetical protein [Acutalibacter sp.]